MTASRPDNEAIFHAARAIPDSDRRREYVRQACGGDETRITHVEALLAAADAPDSLLDRPAGGDPVATIDRPTTEGQGTVIGPYKLLEQIGEGGFGVVYMAEQTQPVRRKVALKILKPGMDTRQVVARFEAERQALAIMDHPNIAKVHDGGATPSGRPYFVMELMRGVPITEFCDQHHLTPRERLELFLPVCQAVQHAHQKGIIHRDLKPSNILVVMHDTTPVVKVIDFGVAKALGQELTDKTLFTGFAQMVGTPLYMSPEQAGQSGLDIDTRSDIYALGVLLYELLTGTTPFPKERFKQAAYDEIRRIIREEEPPKPSTRLSQLGSRPTPWSAAGDGTRNGSTILASISAQRQTEPTKLRKLMRGELDWIVMKALDKERNRRYESASALAADVQRYLGDEPVLACPPSPMYQFRKFARRHKRALATALGVVLVALAAGVVLAVSNAQINRALQQERQTKQDLVQALYYQRIASAAGARANDQSGRAEELLDQCPGELRGWEWHYLKRLPFASFPALRHPGVLTKLAASPDGRLLASGNAAGGNATVKIWDLQTGAELPELNKHFGFIEQLAFSPDGRRLATGDFRSVRIWDPFTGELLRDLPGPAGIVIALTFSPDGRFLAAACQNDCVRLWDLTTGRQLDGIPEKTVAYNGLAFSPDARRVLTADMEGRVKIYDPSNGQVISSFQGHLQRVWSAAFSHDGRLVALGSEEGTVRIWNTGTGAEGHSLQAHTGLVVDLAFLSGDQRLASCGDDRTLKIWDIATGQEALQLKIFAKRPQALAVSGDGFRLFYRHPGAAGVADSIGVADGTPVVGGHADRGTLVLDGHFHNVAAVAWSPDSRRLASASWDKSVKIWDALTGREQLTLRGHEASLTDVTFSPDGRLVASASWDEAIRVWDAATGQELHTLRTQGGGPVYGVAFHPRDGRVLASAHHDGSIKLWDAVTGQMRRATAAQQHPVLGVAFSPDGRLLAGAAGKNTGNIAVWDTASLARKHELRRDAPGICSSLAFHPNGRWAAGIATTNDVYAWDLATGDVVGRLPHPLRPNRLAFNLDGRLLVTVGQDPTVRLWDILTTQPRVEIRGHVGDVWCAAFSPDGRRLATGAGYKGRGEIRIREAALWEKKS